MSKFTVTTTFGKLKVGDLFTYLNRKDIVKTYLFENCYYNSISTEGSKIRFDNNSQISIEVEDRRKENKFIPFFNINFGERFQFDCKVYVKSKFVFDGKHFDGGLRNEKIVNFKPFNSNTLVLGNRRKSDADAELAS